MAVRTRSNYKSTKNTLIATNGVGAISGADMNNMLEDTADSMVMFEDLTNGVDVTAQIVADGVGIRNDADTDDKWYRFLFFAGSNAGGTSDVTAASILPNDSVATITFHVAGVAADGSEGYSGVHVAGFRKDGAAAVVMISTQTDLHVKEDSSGTPSIAISINTTNIRVTMVTSGVVVYHWTIWADVAVSAV